jgi:hypothetical protein
LTVCLLLGLPGGRTISAQVSRPIVVIMTVRWLADHREQSRTRPALAISACPDEDLVKVVATGALGDHAPPAAHREIGFDIRAFERALRFGGWSRREAVADAGRLARQLSKGTQWT